MGMLIGKGGAGLRDMQEKSRVKVHFVFGVDRCLSCLEKGRQDRRHVQNEMF